MRRGNERQRGDRHGSAETNSHHPLQKNLVLRNEIFLSKPTGLVYHHAESVYIINSLCELYLITPLGVYKKLSFCVCIFVFAVGL